MGNVEKIKHCEHHKAKAGWIRYIYRKDYKNTESIYFASTIGTNKTMRIQYALRVYIISKIQNKVYYR